MTKIRLPMIIQGGMGAGVSDWRLAKAVAMTGQMGVVSGTAIDAIVARRLQLGDEGGHLRRALSHFPIPGVAERILARYFVPDGKSELKPFKSKPMPSEAPSQAGEELLVASSFAEVFLAKEGHDGLIGINLLEKIQAPTLQTLYGAMLAGVSCVLMGAGIPKAIPGILDQLSRREAVELRIDVQGGAADQCISRFDPAEFWPDGPAELPRPDFYAIVSSATLATMLAKKASGKVNGFVVEGPLAGGHNAPPRGPLQLTSEGEPIYGTRDEADLKAIAALGVPFWLAGAYAQPEKVVEALREGAAGVQVGTAFAFCEESGLEAQLKREVLEMSARGEAKVFTDPVASPTGFPFKILRKEGTIAEPQGPAPRKRICDLGYLRHAYVNEDGKTAWRCPAEPVDDYIRKGGKEEDTVGRVCVCNGLMANIGLGQVRGENGVDSELPLITCGNDVATVARFLQPGATSYRAADVVDALLRDVRQEAEIRTAVTPILS